MASCRKRGCAMSMDRKLKDMRVAKGNGKRVSMSADLLGKKPTLVDGRRQGMQKLNIKNPLHG